MRVLLTGATGYVGRRLLLRLLQDKKISEIKLLVRSPKLFEKPADKRVKVIGGSTFDFEALRRATKNVDAAYYLVHSIFLFRRGDAPGAAGSARNFLDACIKNKVKTLIYLGALGSGDTASEPLGSSLQIGEILSSQPAKIKTLWFRAGMIIGSGSASFEMIKSMVQKQPVKFAPCWVKTRFETVSVENVIEYLDCARTLAGKKNHVIDLGCGELSFQEMMQKTARLMMLKRFLVALPVRAPLFSSLWLALLTPVSYRIARNLVDAFQSETLKFNDNAKNCFPKIRVKTFEESALSALYEAEKNIIVSRWSDSGKNPAHALLEPDLLKGLYRIRVEREISKSKKKDIFQKITGIGGKSGWFNYHFLWMIRGFVDKLFGGYGLSRGRRCFSTLRIGDSLDFFKVVDLVPGKRLLLASEMRLPGKGWMEFVLEKERLVETAYFIPKGVMGYLYWYLLWPFHKVTFIDIAKSLARG